MPSPTQRALTADDVRTFVRASFGPGVLVTGCAQLGGGGFAAVWRVDLDGDRRVVLKVAPPAGTRLLRYEAGLARAEADYFRIVGERCPGVPVPRVLHHGQDPAVCDGDWLFTGFLPGTPLSELAGQADQAGLTAPDEAAVRRQSGAALAEVHRVTGDRFGYPGDRAHGPDWPAAFAAVIEDLLADAQDWAVPLPVPADRVRRVVAASGDALALVDRPALVHFDLWDGNVLATPGPDGIPALSGLVDGERCLYGDPLIDLVSPVLFRRIEDEPDSPFLRGYESAAGPVRLDAAARRRLGLYRMYLYLLMVVEMPSRGMTELTDPGRRDFLCGLLTREVDELDR